MTPDLSQNPDIAECFTYGGRKYRVNGWYRELPMVPPTKTPDTPQFLHDMLVEMWHESHPHPEKEHKLIPCTREEADWVCGCGVAGVLARISDITREGQYVQWPEEHINSQRESWIRRRTTGPQESLYISRR